MSLAALYRRLVEVARMRVQSGELTERGLARLCGISQPHMHNALNGIRDFSTSAADRLLVALDLSIPELLWRYPGEAESGIRAVPVLRNRIGPGTEAVFTQFCGYMPFALTAVRNIVEPVAARIAPDLVLPRAVSANDLVLLDQNPVLRASPGGGGCWVVFDGTGLRVRYVKLGGARIYLATEATINEPGKWESIPLRERKVLDIVRARIVWIGRDMETALESGNIQAEGQHDAGWYQPDT